MSLVRSPLSKLLCICVIASASGGLAYNSEEHKLVTDLGASRVKLDPSITLPGPTGFQTPSATDVLNEFRSAKEKAVGFQTNNPSDFNSQKKGPQDNSYWGPDFHQAAYNKNLWIPDGANIAYLKGRRLMVTSHVNAEPAQLSLGTLAALYGDYRRSVHCEGPACYLTQSDRSKSSTPTATFETPGVMFFKRGYDCFGGIVNCGWEPTSTPSALYLGQIGSGLVPPFNALGNAAYLEDDYGEAGWWGDELMRVASMNDWHFSTTAAAWYVGMHRLALLAAERSVSDPEQWNKALHYEANALHTLVDLFAFGHMVTSRDATAWGVVNANGEDGSATWAWMQNVLQQGGAQRVPKPCGASATCLQVDFRPDLAAGLQTLRDVDVPRADFMRSYVNSLAGLSWAGWSENERGEHDAFNVLGACVRNLNGQSFLIAGDGSLRSMDKAECGPNAVDGIEVIATAVQLSVQSLFDAQLALTRKQATVESLGALGSPYFAALRQLPVFVDHDLAATVAGVTGQGRFNGRWTRYAQAVDLIAAAGVVPSTWERCEMAYVGADVTPPAPNQPRCTELPLLILRAPSTVSSGDSVTFVARGGTDRAAFPAVPAYRWSLRASGSGGSIDPLTGRYTAGAKAGVTDEVTVTDTDGSSARVLISVADPQLANPAPAGVDVGQLSPPAEAEAKTNVLASSGCGCVETGGGSSLLMLAFLAAVGLARRR